LQWDISRRTRLCGSNSRHDNIRRVIP
jgi:hypothetical protein